MTSDGDVSGAPLDYLGVLLLIIGFIAIGVTGAGESKSRAHLAGLGPATGR
jgi:hypothetical protein